ERLDESGGLALGPKFFPGPPGLAASEEVARQGPTTVLDLVGNRLDAERDSNTVVIHGTMMARGVPGPDRRTPGSSPHRIRWDHVEAKTNLARRMLESIRR